MTITLPDELREPLERKAHAAGFATIAEYLCRLVEEDIEEDEITPADLGYASAEQLETKLEAAARQRPTDPGHARVLGRAQAPCERALGEARSGLRLSQVRARD
jgi:hypothetical protein